MKTSNKLLIALAVSCFIIPLTGFMIVSKLYYRPAGTDHNIFNTAGANQDFKTPTQGLSSIVIRQPYHVLIIEDGKEADIELNLHTSDDYGIKISEDLTGVTSFHTSNDTLTIRFKDGVSPSSLNDRVLIKAYAHEFTALSVNKAGNFIFTATGDSLKTSFRNCSYVSPGEVTKDTYAKVVNGDTVIHRTFNQNGLTKLSIALDNSKLVISPLVLERLKLDMQNHSSAEFNGAPPNIRTAAIGQLQIQSKGENSIKIQNYTIKEAKGDISDETAIEASTPVLRQLLKK